jgi:hypothetical protein
MSCIREVWTSCLTVCFSSAVATGKPPIELRQIQSLGWHRSGSSQSARMNGTAYRPPLVGCLTHLNEVVFASHGLDAARSRSALYVDLFELMASENPLAFS